VSEQRVSVCVCGQEELASSNATRSGSTRVWTRRPGNVQQAATLLSIRSSSIGSTVPALAQMSYNSSRGRVVKRRPFCIFDRVGFFTFFFFLFILLFNSSERLSDCLSILWACQCLGVDR
jgi:hypothetical protein